MKSVERVKSEQLNLPVDVARKLKGKEVEILELKEGFLLRPVADSIQEARGFLKSRRFSTNIYLRNKLEEKALEK